MRDHLEAVKARLDDTAPTFLTWATSGNRYFVVSATGADLSDEDNVATQRDTFDALVRVKAVTGTPEGVYTLLDLARDELSPDFASSSLTVAGRKAEIRFVRSEFVDVDQDVTITGTDRHPAVGVDTYRIVSQPA